MLQNSHFLILKGGYHRPVYLNPELFVVYEDGQVEEHKTHSAKESFPTDADGCICWALTIVDGEVRSIAFNVDEFVALAPIGEPTNPSNPSSQAPPRTPAPEE